ncbi:MAG: glycosyltransferase family 4 protein, partial [Theionarchaea archaeon]|nr:glycosyltransferase family 4 protein [Theionarchaea archaeon]
TATKVAGLLPYSAFRNTTWRMLRTSLDSFDAFVACSGFLRRRFELLHPSAGEVYAIHNPVIVGDETSVPENRILYVGRLSIEKGTMVLLKAFSSLLEVRPESRLTIVGTGPLEGRLRRGVSDSAQLKNSVTIAGYVPPPEVSRFFERSSIVVVPSVWPEPFGRTPAEAMAAARPVIASSSGGIPEVVEHGKTGLLVSPGKPEALSVALGELLPDRRKIVKMGHRGHERAARTFSRRVIASKFAGLYEKIT